MVFVSNMLDSNYGDTLNLSYILKDFIDNEVPVAVIKDTEIIKPFDSETVRTDIDYYDKDSDEESQQKLTIIYCLDGEVSLATSLWATSY